MTTAIEDLQSICAEMFARWDADMKAGKLLSALEGRILNYDPRVTRVRDVLIKHEHVSAARVQELLEANNAYLERARKAEAERDEAQEMAAQLFGYLYGGDPTPDIVKTVSELTTRAETATRERDEARAELEIWKSVFPDVAPSRVQRDRSLVEADLERVTRERDEARVAGHEDAAAWMERCGPEGVKMAGWFRGQMEACRRTLARGGE